MERRNFLTASVAASALAMVGSTEAQPQMGATSAGTPREFYLFRRYSLRSGPQTGLTESYVSDALIPALTRMNMGPVGAFRVEFGPETPVLYVLIPGASAQALAELDLHLATDADFMKAASPFWNATAAARPYERVESSLMAAFQGWPKLTPPAAAATRAKRIFQLRTYESPSEGDHVRKVEMFHSGEFDIFLKAGFHPVFFGDTLIGSRLPNLTYMLSFADQAELESCWNAFRDAPAWKKLSADPHFASDQIVTNITNLVLSPLNCSQL